MENMGKSFFEKLQKGMETEEIPDSQEEPKPEEELSRQEIEKEPAIVSTSVEFSSGQTEKREKSPKKTAKNKTVKKNQEKKIKVVKEENSKEPDIDTKEEKRWFESEGQLTVDVYQTDGELVIQSAIAGIKPGDLDITVEKDLIIIKGVREKVTEKKSKNYFFQECYWGKFSREIISPVEIDGGRTKASIKDGILTIRIPKIEREKMKRVAVIDNNDDN